MVTKDELLAVLDYDRANGQFRWKMSMRGPAKAGDIAGHRRADGYCLIKIKQRGYFVHRLVWLVEHGSMPEMEIDHIDGDPSNNRIENLRDVPHQVNAQNVRVARSSNRSSRLIGAHWCRTWKRWKSAINAGGKLQHIGWFDTEQQAHEAYVAAKRALHPGCTI